MTDQKIRDVLHAAAGTAVLPGRFGSPGAVVRTLAARRRKSQVRVALIAAGAMLLSSTAGLAIAARAGLLGNYKQAQADAQQVAEAVRTAEESAPSLDQLSLAYPVASPLITDRFGPRRSVETGEISQHTGTDFGLAAGQPVTAAADGTVAAAGAYPELGNVVVITHGKLDGAAISTWYAYSGELRVRPGQKVKRGDIIAVSGISGGSTGPHIHFEVRVDGKPVDPQTWLMVKAGS